MEPELPNPSFPRAIPHGMLIIDLLTKGVLFGVFSGCPRAVSRVGSRSPSGDRFRDAFETSVNGFLVKR